MGVLLRGIPRIERCGWRGRRERQVGWVFPPITPQELQQWEAFELVMGPILIHDRIEMSVGIAAMTAAAPYAPSHRPLKLTDFMPRWDSEAEVPGSQSAEDIMEALRGLAEKGKDVGDGNVHP